ncbi:MAG: XRE family transcriptional regulator [Verrucomicrobiota bacterium]|nr:XRE family transcriptional regulator [Verrucomicrobiota bacterium]
MEMHKSEPPSPPSRPSEPDESPDQPPRFDFSVLRELRKKANLTLEEVHKLSGVSIAAISKLERNQTPTADLDTLYRLARAFGLHGADLLALAEFPMAVRKKAQSYKSNGFDFRKLSHVNLDVFMGTASKGAITSRPEIHHDEHEYCWVLDGQLRLTLAHETMELKAGESVCFDGAQPHSYEAITAISVLIIHLRKQLRYEQ